MNHSNQKRILIIEDNVTYRRMLQIRLESIGYRVVVASDGLQGLNLAQKERPDLIILDLMLPEMGGHKVSRLIKFDSKIKNIPIVILTCKNLAKDVELAIENHVDAFIVKGTKTDILLNVVEKLLRKRKET